MAWWRTELKVRGALPFPIDMLRYDRCSPKTEADSAVVARSLSDPMIDEVEVALVHDSHERRWLPTTGRWKSFGWIVVSMGDALRYDVRK